jgi:hypothetical protein
MNRPTLYLFLITIIFQSIGFKTFGSENKKQPTGPNGRIAVFLDSERWFDEDFVRQEIPVVDYVRNREQADIHIIISRHNAGTSGANYAISFIGSRLFEGQNLDLTYWAPSTNSSDQTRRGYSNVIKIGLVTYIAKTPMITSLNVNFSNGKKGLTNETEFEEKEDPWKNWVFELYGGGNFSKEERLSNFSFRTGFFADMVTTDWKLRFRPYFNFAKRTFVTTEEDIVSSTYRHGYSSYIVKSLSDHLSLGLFSSGLASTFHNIRFGTDLVPALEWSLYPYEEATRRSVTLAYRVGYGYNYYLETTIFEKDKEWILTQALEASVRFQQTWGNFRAGLTGSHHLTDFSKNRAQIFTSLNLRVFQGFSINFWGNYELINDLIAIPAGNLTLEEILLARTQQATSYSISGSIGLSYTFGSKFSSAYNPRF